MQQTFIEFLLHARRLLGSFMLIVWFTLTRAWELVSWVTLEMEFCSCASFFLPWSVELHDPWQPKDSSEKIALQRLKFSSLSLVVKEQVSPELCWAPLGFPTSQIVRNCKCWKWAGGSALSLCSWVFLLSQRQPPRAGKLKEKDII